MELRNNETMAQKGLLRNKQNYIQYYRFEENRQRNKESNSNTPQRILFFLSTVTKKSDPEKNTRLKHTRYLLLRVKS